MTSAQRERWMDGLRGLAIVAVLVVHAQGLAGSVPPVDALDRHLEPVWMPVLVTLSGMLLPRSLAKGPRRHLLGKLRSLLWPYLLWGLLDVVLVLAEAPLFDEPRRWEAVPKFFYLPQTYTWFLGYLLV